MAFGPSSLSPEPPDRGESTRARRYTYTDACGEQKIQKQGVPVIGGTVAQMMSHLHARFRADPETPLDSEDFQDILLEEERGHSVFKMIPIPFS